MRAKRLLAAIVLVLAGCGPGGKAADVAANEASAPNAAPPGRKPAASPAPPASRRVGDSIPAAFHGVFDTSARACGRPGDGRLAVAARELRFHESIGSVRSVAVESPGLIRVDADYQGEGEKWRAGHALRLSGDGSKLTVSGEGMSFERVRCAAGGL